MKHSVSYLNDWEKEEMKMWFPLAPTMKILKIEKTKYLRKNITIEFSNNSCFKHWFKCQVKTWNITYVGAHSVWREEKTGRMLTPVGSIATRLEREAWLHDYQNKGN